MPPTTGTIKRITDKGFGFIATPDGTEYFFHQSACTSTPFDSMREGEQVTFTVGQGPKGPRVENANLCGPLQDYRTTFAWASIRYTVFTSFAPMFGVGFVRITRRIPSR